MLKTGQVQVGKTPSVVSGERSTAVVDGEPVSDAERPEDPGLKKLAKALDSESDTTRS